MMKRFSYLLPVFLLLFFSCSENPSEVTSKISSSPVVQTSEELGAPSWDELEIEAVEGLSKEEATVLHQWHHSFLFGELRTKCDTPGHLVWGDPTCRPVAIALYNSGRCPIKVELKCGGNLVSEEFVHHGERKVLHGKGNHIFVHCLVHGHLCKARYAIVWL